MQVPTAILSRAALWIVAVGLFGSGCGAALDQAAANDVKLGIQQVRHLDFVQDVPFVIKSSDEAQKILVSKLGRDNSDEELRIGGEAGAMTGLFKEGIDLKNEQLKLMRDQVAGFYDPHDKVMVEVRGKSVLGTSFTGRPEFADELLHAHELTHALQDQHFVLDDLLKRVKNNDDEELAMHSLIEGDATLAGLGYVQGGLTEQEEEKIVAHFAAMPESFEPESSGTPMALSVPLMFQYTQGTRFVAEAWRRGGWAAVDALYRDPPVSTQQIMHPSLYFDHRQNPLLILIDGYEGQLAGWKKVDDDTFGELLIKLMLRRNLPQDSPALLLSDKWTGDHVIALERDHRLMLLWVIGFENSEAARSFASTYDEVLDHLNRPNEQHLVATHADDVLVILGPRDIPFGRLAPAIWRASTISSANPLTPDLAQPPALKINIDQHLKPACTIPTTCPPPADKSWDR
jgi:hypothetical protein